MKSTATVEIMKIDPEMAESMLANRWHEQRNVRIAHVARLVSDMESGRFGISPDAITLIKGKLANGQHRLEAVVRSGKPQTFLVMESNDEELYKIVDSGLKRTVADGLIGVSYAKEISSIARWVMAYEEDTLFPSARASSEAASKPSGGKHRTFISQAAVIDYCIDNQESLTSAASFTVSLWSLSRVLPVSLGGALYVLGCKHGKKDLIEKFLHDLYVGGCDNCANDLRNRLNMRKTSKAKVSMGYVFGLCVKAFNAFCRGSRPSKFQWSSREGFPEIEN